MKKHSKLAFLVVTLIALINIAILCVPTVKADPLPACGNKFGGDHYSFDSGCRVINGSICQPGNADFDLLRRTNYYTFDHGTKYFCDPWSVSSAPYCCKEADELPCPTDTCSAATPHPLSSPSPSTN